MYFSASFGLLFRKPDRCQINLVYEIICRRGIKLSKKIRVALLGLGRIAEGFAENFLEQIQEGNRPIE